MNKEKESIGILGLLIFLGVLTGGMIAGYFLGHGHYKNKK